MSATESVAPAVEAAEHPVSLAIRYDAAFNSRDGAALARLLHPAAELHEADGSVYLGRAGAREMLRSADAPHSSTYVIASRYTRVDHGVTGFVLLAAVDPTSGLPASRFRVEVDFQVADGLIVSVERSLRGEEGRIEQLELLEPAAPT